MHEIGISYISLYFNNTNYVICFLKFFHFNVNYISYELLTVFLYFIYFLCITNFNFLRVTNSFPFYTLLT